MKYSFYFLLLVVSLSTNAQHVRAFTGLGVYLDNDFNNSTFIGAKIGTEFKLTSFLKPELEINYQVGALKDVEIRDSQGNLSNFFVKKVSAINYGFCPKIAIGDSDNEKGTGHFVILPRYSISKIEATGNYTIINQSNLSKSIEEKEIITTWQHSLGIGIGIDVGVSNNYDTIALNLYYNGIDMGNALNNLKYNGTAKFSTKNVIGFGINYYFSFKKRLETK
jgi:opacity protein-like surface antigen